MPEYSIKAVLGRSNESICGCHRDYAMFRTSLTLKDASLPISRLRPMVNDRGIVYEDACETERRSYCLRRIRGGLCLNSPSTLRDDERLTDALERASDR